LQDSSKPSRNFDAGACMENWIVGIIEVLLLLYLFFALLWPEKL